ncbi:MAG: Ig-like domain-containing protein [Candidatus Acidiferrum sp.]
MRRASITGILSLASLLMAACSGMHSNTNSGGSGGATSPTSPSSASLTGVSVSPNPASVSVSATVSFRAIGTYSDGTTQDLTSTAQWSSSNTSVAAINTPGVATGMAAGTATIAAQSGGLAGSAALTVSSSGGGGGGGGTGGGGGAGANLSSITIAPANPSIPVHTMQQLTATGTYTDGSSADLTALVTWSSSANTVATVNATGAITGLSAGTAMITATLNSVSQSTTATVTAPTISSISVTPEDLTLPLGISQQYTASAIYSDGTTADLTSGVTWSSSSAVVTTIDSTGLASMLSAGTTTITASVGSLTDSTDLTVVGAHLTSITVSPATASLADGTEQQFTATGTFDDGSTQILASAQWSSSAPNVLTVNSTGLGTAVAAGTATVTATSGTIKGTASVTVTNATLVSLTIAPTNSTMPIDATKQFTATGTFSDNSTQDMTQLVLWKSSKPSVAIINASGLVSSVATGTTTIQASSGSVVQSTTLTVSTVGLASITITPANPTINKGTLLKLTATATYSDGSTATPTSVSWKSSKPQFANVRSTGIVHAKKAGTATISASAFGLTGTTTLTVGSGTLVSIEITPANDSVSVGATQQFTATGTFSDATKQDMTLNAHWSSTDASVATIANGPTQAGLATTYNSGTTTIGVNSRGTTASTSLTVN